MGDENGSIDWKKIEKKREKNEIKSVTKPRTNRLKTRRYNNNAMFDIRSSLRPSGPNLKKFADFFFLPTPDITLR